MTTLRRLTLLTTHLTPATRANRLPTIGSSLSRSNANMVDKSQLKSEIEKNVKDNFVMVYSKSYCPYCKATKSLLEGMKSQLGDKQYKVIELDEVANGSDIQDVLAEKTSQRTVPQVFINSEFIGGNSDLQALKGGALEKKLTAPVKA